MHYSIRHVTRFRYSAPVRESVMELRTQPRSEGPQALRSFQIATNPRAQLYAYTDYLGNAVYHFNVLREHQELRIETQAVIEMAPFPALPEACDPLEWQRFNDYNLSSDHFDLLEPSKFAAPSDALAQFVAKHDLASPQGDPLTELFIHPLDYCHYLFGVSRLKSLTVRRDNAGDDPAIRKACHVDRSMRSENIVQPLAYNSGH